jgi:hypothetical protein
MKYLLTVLAVLGLCGRSLAQTEALVTDTNGTVISGRTNATITWSNAFNWNNSTNAATTRNNLGLRLLALTNTNNNNFRNGIQLGVGDTVNFNGLNLSNAGSALNVGIPTENIYVTGGLLTATLETNVAYLNGEGLFFETNNTVGPSNSRASLNLATTNTPTFAGLTLGGLTNASPRVAILGTNGAVSAGSVPSGAAAVGSDLQADGSGGSVFVASRTVTKVVTTNVVRTNVTSTSIANALNLVAELGTWSLDANSTYRVEWAIISTNQATNSIGIHGLVLSAALYDQTSSHIGFGTAPTTGTPVVVNYTTGTLVTLPAGSFTGQRSQVGVAFLRTTNAITAAYHFAASAATNTNNVTLLSGSTISFTKIAP